jgi:hypothetical protein
MGEPRLAATDRHGLDAPDIGFGRDRIRVRRWALVVVEAVGGACKQADPHIVLRHDDGAVTMERRIPAGLLAMEMGTTRYFMGRFELLVMAALIPSCRGASSASTMMMPSSPITTRMLPPWPSSM